MKIIFRPRQTGKTDELIRISAQFEEQGECNYIVCSNHPEAYRIAQRAKEMDLQIGFPLTFDELIGQSYSSRNIKFFVIDNVELLLQYLSRVPIHAITLTRYEDEHSP